MVAGGSAGASSFAPSMSTALAPGLARKLKKVLDTRLDAAELVASLGNLSEFYTDNTAETRRSLRSTIEKRGISINEEFLAASERAQAALDQVEAEVNELAACCERTQSELTKCSDATGGMLAEIERMKYELEGSEKRSIVVAEFLESFQLAPHEVTSLQEGDIDEDFFTALARVQDIHNNCKTLLRTHHQRAGLELMDMMSGYQETAFERLCRWVQENSRDLGDADSQEVSPMLRRAAAALRDRQVLFKYCAEEVANTRHNALFRRFISALTRGGPGGMPRPIEIHAHDPRRYVGDMLAWLHQAVAGERELISQLFGDVDVSEKQPKAGEEVASPSANADVAAVLDRIFEAVCRPFKVRVEQVLHATPGILLAYRLSNLLEFYTHTIGALLGPSSALSGTLRTCCQEATKCFYDLLKSRGDKLLRAPPAVPADLSPPVPVSETLNVLLEIMETYETAMVPQGAEKADFSPVINAVLNPLIQVCEKSAQVLTSTTNTLDTSTEEEKQTKARIYMINCLGAVKEPLSTYSMASEQVKTLSVPLDSYMDSLVEVQVVVALEKCSLQGALHSIKQWKAQIGEGVSSSLSSQNGMSEEELSSAFTQFFSFISGKTQSLPEFEEIQAPRVRTGLTTRVARAVAAAYEEVHVALSDPANGFPGSVKELLRHTPNDVRLILGLQE